VILRGTRRFAALALVVVTVAWVATPPRSKTHTIKIAQFAFDPAELRVARGDTVVWENADILPHTTAADSAAWTSGELTPRGRFRFVATDTGRFAYHCAAHPTMHAVLVVN
jgi:plastocyanin